MTSFRPKWGPAKPHPFTRKKWINHPPTRTRPVRIPQNLKRWDDHTVEKHRPSLQELEDFLGDVVHHKGRIVRKMEISEHHAFKKTWSLAFVTDSGFYFPITEKFIEVVHHAVKYTERHGAFILYRVPFKNTKTVEELYRTLLEEIGVEDSNEGEEPGTE